MPNVGKSSFFKLLTKLNVVIENYPFSTIKPNIAIVEYQDKNLKMLASIYKTKKVIYEKAMIYDIAGLVKGASAGIGLGNNFLAHIQEVDLICHVIKCFDKSNSEQFIIDNYEIINLELIIHDQKILENSLRLWEKKTTISPTIANHITLKTLKVVKKFLDQNIYLFRKISIFSSEELKTLKQFCFLTLKPVVILANITESDILAVKSSSKWKMLQKIISENNSKIYYFPINFLLELTKLKSVEQRMFFFTDYQNCENQTNVNFIIAECFRIVGYSFFFTCGQKEVRSWNYKVANNDIRNVAGNIHSTFVTKFIMAKVINYQTVLQNIKLSLQSIYRNHERTVNKKYHVQYGDIINVLVRN